MNVLLVASNQGKSGFEMKGFLSPTFGLYRIKSYLEANGHNCSVLEPSITDPEEHIIRYGDSYDVIGFSSLHATLERDLGLIWTAKKHSKSILVVGGIEATLNSSIFKKYSPVDYIVYGEGEKPMLSICNGDFILLHDPLTEEEFRKVTVGMNLKEIPYDVMWSETRKRYPAVSIEESNTIRLFTSSHCPMGCTFCSATNFLRGKPKYLAGEDIVALIDNALETWPSTKQIFFHDENFLLGKRGKDIWREIGDLDFKVPFMGQVRIDDITPEIVNHLGNFRLISVGVESWSQNILDEFKKSLRADEIDDRIETILGAGIGAFINIILTSPNCEREDVEITMVKCEEWMNRGVDLGINLYVDAYPGTEIIGNAEVEYREVMVPNTRIKFKKMWRVLPKDLEIRSAVLKTEKAIEGKILRSSMRSKLILKNMRSYLGVIYIIQASVFMD